MPIISQFYGIKIIMLYDDHNPPHFHVFYNEHRARVIIESLEIKGTLPKRAERMVLEWANLHQDKLMEDWNLAAEHKILNTIDPLP